MAKRTASDFLILGREDAVTPQPEVNNSQRVSSPLDALPAFARWASLGRLVVFAAGLIMVSTTNVGAAPLLVGNATFSADTILGGFEPVSDIAGPSFLGVHLSNSQQEQSGGLPGEALGVADADTVASSPTSSLAEARAKVRATNDAAKADAVVMLSFAVVPKQPGGVPVAAVPVDIGGRLFTHVEALFPASSPFQFISAAVATAGIDVGELVNSVGDQVRSSCNNDPKFFCEPDVSKQFAGKFDVAPDRELPVVLTANTFIADDLVGGAPPGTKAQALAIADPTIVIDPNFPFKDDFEVVFSPNLIPPLPAPSPASVPEPPTWALMAFGLGAAGSNAGRRLWRRIRASGGPSSLS